MSSLVQLLEHGPIRELKLARAPVNAFNNELCAALLDALKQAFADEVRGIVLAGGEGVFSAGMDVPYLLAHGDDRQALFDSWNRFFDVARALAGSPIPVAVSIGGHAPAAGCLLSLCCDYRVMTRSPSQEHPYLIGLNEVQVGLSVPDGVQHLMRRTVGRRWTERLLLFGTMIPAEQALQIGLVDELADTGDTTARAVAWLQALSQLPRQPMLQTRAVMRADLIDTLRPDHLQLERALIDTWYQRDTQAALRALVARLEKPRP